MALLATPGRSYRGARIAKSQASATIAPAAQADLNCAGRSSGQRRSSHAKQRADTHARRKPENMGEDVGLPFAESEERQQHHAAGERNPVAKTWGHAPRPPVLPQRGEQADSREIAVDAPIEVWMAGLTRAFNALPAAPAATTANAVMPGPRTRDRSSRKTVPKTRLLRRCVPLPCRKSAVTVRHHSPARMSPPGPRRSPATGRRGRRDGRPRRTTTGSPSTLAGFRDWAAPDGPVSSRPVRPDFRIISCEFLLACSASSAATRSEGAGVLDDVRLDALALRTGHRARPRLRTAQRRTTRLPDAPAFSDCPKFATPPICPSGRMLLEAWAQGRP